MNEAPSSRRPLKSRNTGWAATATRLLVRVGVRPNAVSIASVLFAALAGVALRASGQNAEQSPAWFFFLAAAFIQCRLLCNLFDGMIAIEGGFKTKSGEIFNELPDRFADLLIIGGAGYAHGATHGQTQLAWIVAGLAVTTAYVRALGVAAGASQHFIGPMAKQHRMALMTAALVLNGIWLLVMDRPFPLLFWTLMIMGAGCLITIGRRCRRIIGELESK